MQNAEQVSGQAIIEDGRPACPACQKPVRSMPMQADITPFRTGIPRVLPGLRRAICQICLHRFPRLLPAKRLLLRLEGSAFHLAQRHAPAMPPAPAARCRSMQRRAPFPSRTRRPKCKRIIAGLLSCRLALPSAEQQQSGGHPLPVCAAGRHPLPHGPPLVHRIRKLNAPTKKKPGDAIRIAGFAVSGRPVISAGTRDTR